MPIQQSASNMSYEYFIIGLNHKSADLSLREKVLNSKLFDTDNFTNDLMNVFKKVLNK